MGLEAATYIGQLTTTNPDGGDPKTQGDDHIRLIKSALQATFPNLNFAITFNSFAVTYLDEGSASSVATALSVPSLGGNNVLTGTLQLNFSDNGAGPQYRFDVRSASTSPAADDDLIEQRFIGVNDAGTPEDIAYVGIGATIKDKVDGTEDGEFYIKTAVAGAIAKRFKLGAGLYTPNATSGDKGADTINAKHFYKDGVEVNPVTDAWLLGTTGNIADDTAFSFTPPNNAGKIIFSTNGTSLVFQGEANYYAALGGGMQAGLVGTSFNVETTVGVLAGTTLADGKISIRAATDGKIYIENRSGVTRDLTYRVTQ